MVTPSVQVLEERNVRKLEQSENNPAHEQGEEQAARPGHDTNRRTSKDGTCGGDAPNRSLATSEHQAAADEPDSG